MARTKQNQRKQAKGGNKHVCCAVYKRDCGKPVLKGYHWCAACIQPHLDGQDVGYVADTNEGVKNCNRMIEGRCSKNVKEEGGMCAKHEKQMKTVVSV